MTTLLFRPANNLQIVGGAAPEPRQGFAPLHPDFIRNERGNPLIPPNRGGGGMYSPTEDFAGFLRDTKLVALPARPWQSGAEIFRYLPAAAGNSEPEAS